MWIGVLSECARVGWGTPGRPVGSSAASWRRTDRRRDDDDHAAGRDGNLARLGRTAHRERARQRLPGVPRRCAARSARVAGERRGCDGRPRHGGPARLVPRPGTRGGRGVPLRRRGRSGQSVRGARRVSARPTPVYLAGTAPRPQLCAHARRRRAGGDGAPAGRQDPRRRPVPDGHRVLRLSARRTGRLLARCGERAGRHLRSDGPGHRHAAGQPGRAGRRFRLGERPDARFGLFGRRRAGDSRMPGNWCAGATSTARTTRS